MFFNLSHALSFFHVKGLALHDNCFRKMVSHQLLKLEQDFKQFSTKNGKILFLEQLRVDLGERIELGVDLILRN